MPNKLSPIQCYKIAWRGFAKWWLPLCAVAGLLLVVEFIPRLLAAKEGQAAADALTHTVDTLARGELKRIEGAQQQFLERLSDYAIVVSKYSVLALPAVAILTVLLLMVSCWAARGARTQSRSLTEVLYITAVHVLITLAWGVGLLLCVFPGLYLYVRLFHVPVIMLEGEASGRRAVRESWHLTRGRPFWSTALLALMNAGVLAVAGITIIGLIPASGFVNTARAAAYQQLTAAAPPPPPAPRTTGRSDEQGPADPPPPPDEDVPRLE